MPMPHRTFAQVAKRRLVGKEGKERIREVNALLTELPDYKNGPYADLRKSLLAEIEDTRVAIERRPSRLDRRPPRGRGADRARRTAQRRQVVDPPGAVRDPDQDRRLRRSPRCARSRRSRGSAACWSSWSRSPGLIEGANEDRGGGRALLGVLRSADAIVYCARAGADPAGAPGRPATRSRRRASTSRRSSPRPGRTRRPPDAVDGLRGRVPRPRGGRRSRSSTRPRSTRFRDAVWRLTGLIRVHLRANGSTDDEPLALHPPARPSPTSPTRSITTSRPTFVGARIWGPSARFDGQRVGRDHVVADGDSLEILR